MAGGKFRHTTWLIVTVEKVSFNRFLNRRAFCSGNP
jgi:hypothetical protein